VTGERHRRPKGALVLDRQVRRAAVGFVHRSGEHTVAELGDLLGVTRSTACRAIERDAARQRTQLPGRTGLGGSPS